MSVLEKRPTLAGFTNFVRNNMGVPESALPNDATGQYWISFAYEVALQIVNRQIAIASCKLYTLAVYNLGGDNLINFTPDVPNCTAVEGSNPPACYFANLRSIYNTYGFVSGVITSAADESTSESMVVMDAAAKFTLANLQQLKTPWGRAYLGIAQSAGPSVWGIT